MGVARDLVSGSPSHYGFELEDYSTSEGQKGMFSLHEAQMYKATGRVLDVEPGSTLQLLKASPLPKVAAPPIY